VSPNQLERTAREASKRWVGKTLQAFREEAERELNGNAFDAMRPSTEGVLGPRLMLAICVTGQHELSLTEKCFDFTDTGVIQDWRTYTLAEMVMDAATAGGLGYQDLKDADGKRIAVTFVATQLDKVELLSRIFCLPP
jgi:hypothetical protein